MAKINWDLSPKLLPNIEKSFNESSSIQLVNCQIKESSYIGQLNQYEILLSTKTQINESTKKYKLTENHDTKDSSVQLEIISDLAINQRLSVNIKVMTIDDPVPITTTTNKILTKQECPVADSTGCILCVLWENHVNKLTIDNSYLLTNIITRSFNGRKYISVSENSRIIAIDDIGKFADIDVDVGQKHLITIKGEIIGVIASETYKCCLSCNSKVETMDEFIDKCTKCDAVYKHDKCPTDMSMRFIIESDIKYHYTVTAFKRVIDNIIINDKSDSSITDKLLKAPIMSFFFLTKKNILSAVEHLQWFNRFTYTLYFNN